MIKFNRKVRAPLTEPFDLSPSYAVLRLYDNLAKTYDEEINKSFFKTMLIPIYDLFGARFIAENLIEKPHPSTKGSERWEIYLKELDIYEICVTNMMEAEETCELFK